MKLAEAIKIARTTSVDDAKRFAQHVVPEVVRPARVIWNQAIGALFFVLAVPAFFKAIQLYRTLDTDPQGSFRLAVALIFIAVMVFFGINSFLKARRIASQVRRA
ncbi:MAG TPA: hypothetical protein VGK64_18270 [Bryobacteraceae bacterium]